MDGSRFNNHNSSDDERKARAYLTLLAFAVYMKMHLLVWMTVCVIVLEQQGADAIKTLFVWMSLAWLSGIIAPIASRHWVTWAIWTTLGLAMGYMTLLVWGA